jgi:iron complex transport system ATP-binding protein
MTLLEARGLCLSAGGKALVRQATFTLEPGSLTAMIGPNGAGKTTLLRLALGLLEPDAGEALIDGRKARSLDPLSRARLAAYLPQMREVVWPQPVRDIVSLGRFAYGAAPGRLSSGDNDAVERAMAACDLAGFEDRSVDTLSGGELSRVHIARALASDAPLLVADEPVAALDPRHQHQVMRLFCDAAKAGRGVLTVVHDLALAGRYADRLIWMKEGRIVADGTPRETLTSEALGDVFGIAATVEETGGGGISLTIAGPC